MKRMLFTFLFAIAAFNAAKAAHFAEGPEFLDPAVTPEHTVDLFDRALGEGFADEATGIHTPPELAMLHELSQEEAALQEQEEQAAPFQDALTHEDRPDEWAGEDLQEEPADLLHPAAQQQESGTLPPIVPHTPGVLDGQVPLPPGFQPVEPLPEGQEAQQAPLEPPSQQPGAVRYDRVAQLTPEQRQIVDQQLAKPLDNIAPIQERYPAADVAATRKVFNDEVPQRYLSFPKNYATQPVENLVGIFDNMLLNGIELDATKYVAFIRDAPDIIYQLSRLPNAKTWQKEQFVDLPHNMSALVDMVATEAEDLLVLIGQLHDRYGQYLEKKTIGAWKKQVIKPNVEFDAEQLNQLRHDTVEVRARLEHLYARRQDIMRAIEEFAAVQPPEWVQGNYTDEGSLGRWQKANIYQANGNLRKVLAVMPDYKALLEVVGSKSEAGLKIFLNKLFDPEAAATVSSAINTQRTPEQFIGQLDKALSIFRVKVNEQGFIGQRFGKSEFYKARAERLLNAFKEVYPNISVPSENAATVYGTMKPLSELAPEVANRLNDLKNGSVSFDAFLTEQGIEEFTPKSLLEARVTALKNQFERALYALRTLKGPMNEDALTMQTLLRYLNESYPEFLSERQQFVVRSAKLPLQMVYYADSGLGGVLGKLEKELMDIKQAQTPSSQLSMPSMQEQALLRDRALEPPLRSEGAAALRINTNPFADVLAPTGNAASDQIYQDAINLLNTIVRRAELYDIEGSDALTEEAIEGLVNQLNDAQELGEPQRTVRLRSLLDQIEDINNHQETIVSDENQALVRQGRAYSEAVAQEVTRIVEEQRTIWNQILAKSNGSEIRIESFVDYQNEIVRILHGKDPQDVVLKKLQALQAKLIDVQTAIAGAETVNAQEPAISTTYLNQLETLFSEDVRREAQELNDLLAGAPDTFEMNYLRLYVRKQVQTLIANPDLKKAKALEFITTLLRDVEQQKIHELGGLYAARVSAMDFAIRMNYIRIIQEAIDYAHYHKFTAAQKRTLMDIKEDILANNTDQLQADLASLENALQPQAQDSVIQGTQVQQALLLSYIDDMAGAFVLSDADAARVQELFAQLQAELQALGTAGDPVIMGLIAAPEGFGLLVEKRILLKLELIADYYNFEVFSGNLSEQKIANLKQTINDLAALLQPEVEKIETNLSSGAYAQERPLELRAMSQPMEQAAGIEDLAVTAHEKRTTIQNYLDGQNDFAEKVAALRTQVGTLLKQPTVTTTQTNQVSNALTELVDLASTLKNKVPDAIASTRELIDTNDEIVAKLTERLSILEQEYQSPTVIEEQNIINQEIAEIVAEQKLLDVYYRNLQRVSFTNEQTTEFYGQLLRALRGESFDLLYGFSRPPVSSQGILDDTASFRALELAALSSALDDDETESSLECTRRLNAIYAIETEQQQIFLGLNALKAQSMETVESHNQQQQALPPGPLLSNANATLVQPAPVVDFVPVQSADVISEPPPLGLDEYEEQEVVAGDPAPVVDAPEPIEDDALSPLVDPIVPIGQQNQTPLAPIVGPGNNNNNNNVPMQNPNNQSESLNQDIGEIMSQYERQLHQYEIQVEHLQSKIDGLEKGKMGKSTVCQIVKRMIEELEKKMLDIDDVMDDIYRRLEAFSFEQTGQDINFQLPSQARQNVVEANNKDSLSMKNVDRAGGSGSVGN